MAASRRAPRAPEHDALARVDRLLEHRTRLAICVLLARSEALSFSRLKELLGETDGSLGAQLRKLEDSGYLTVRKEFRERRPVSWYELTQAGRRALRAHLAAMADLFESIRSRRDSERVD